MVITAFWASCTNDSKSDIYQTNRANILNVRDQVNEICINDVFIGSVARLFLLNDYLLIADCKSDDKLIRIFNKDNFQYILSSVTFGGGPNEVANIGHIEVNNAKNEFYVSDHAKQIIFAYNMDSLILDSLYTPQVKARMNKSEFPSYYNYFSDTLSIGLIIRPTGTSGFNQVVARWNMNTGSITPMKYQHPKIEKKRVTMDTSERESIYVEGYRYYDLMTICDFSGNLICNVYGPDWDDLHTNKTSHYVKVSFYKDKIIALYSGRDAFYKDEVKGVGVILPTKFLIFDTQGNYIKTLDVGYNIADFCCDEENNRLIMNFDDDIQFGYIDLKDVL